MIIHLLIYRPAVNAVLLKLLWYAGFQISTANNEFTDDNLVKYVKNLACNLHTDITKNVNFEVLLRLTV